MILLLSLFHNYYSYVLKRCVWVLSWQGVSYGGFVICSNQPTNTQLSSGISFNFSDGGLSVYFALS